MLPNVAGLDLRRRRTAPTDTMLGPRALKRHIEHFRSIFRDHEAHNAYVTRYDHSVMDSYLEDIRATLAAEGPAELALLAAIAQTPPNADGHVVVASPLVSNAQAEWAEKEQALHVLREMWDITAIRSHLAKKMIERGLLDAVANCLNERMFADDLGSEALLTLRELASARTGHILVRWCLLVTDAKANALVPRVCAFVKANPVTLDAKRDTCYAMDLLSAFLSTENNIEQYARDHPDDDDVGWAQRTLFGEQGVLFIDDIFGDEPAARVCKALANIDGAVETVLATGEAFATRDDLRVISMFRDASVNAINALEAMLLTDTQLTKILVEINGLERIMLLFYALAVTNMLREDILKFVRAFIGQVWHSGGGVPAGRAQVQTVLPSLFRHWHGTVTTTVHQQFAGNGQMWLLMRDVASIKELKNMLLLSDDCYRMLRNISDDVGRGDHPLLPRMYEILINVLEEPTTSPMWRRLTERDERDGGEYWAETIIDDILSYVRRDAIDEIPEYKLLTVGKLLENKHEFLNMCIARLPDATMVMLLETYIRKLYTAPEGAVYLRALKALATNGKLWDETARAVGEFTENELMGPDAWTLVVKALHDDDVLAQAACSDPWPSPVAALVLLHKLNDAHAELLATRPLSAADRALLEQRQALYKPILEEILKAHPIGDNQYGALVAKAVAFAQKLLAFPSLQNPQLDALRDEFESNMAEFESNKRQRAEEAGAPMSTDAPASSSAAFVSLLTFLTRPDGWQPRSPRRV